MGLNIELVVHGVPMGQKMWGAKKAEELFFSSFYVFFFTYSSYIFIFKDSSQGMNSQKKNHEVFQLMILLILSFTYIM